MAWADPVAEEHFEHHSTKDATNRVSPSESRQDEQRALTGAGAFGMPAFLLVGGGGGGAVRCRNKSVRLTRLKGTTG